MVHQCFAIQPEHILLNFIRVHLSGPDNIPPGPLGSSCEYLFAKKN
jgi:hypothetical protein